MNFGQKESTALNLLVLMGFESDLLTKVNIFPASKRGISFLGRLKKRFETLTSKAFACVCDLGGTEGRKLLVKSRMSGRGS